MKSVLNNYQRKLKLAIAGMDSAHEE